MGIINSKYFFIFLIVISLVFIVIVNPKFSEKISTKDYFEFAFYDLEAISVTKKGLDIVLKSTEAIKYKDYFVLQKPIIINKSEDKNLHMIEAQYGKYVPNILLTLSGNINYVKDNGVELKTDIINYDMTKNRIFSDTLFTLNIKNSIVTGDGFEYLLKDKKLLSHNIKATIISK